MHRTASVCGVVATTILALGVACVRNLPAPAPVPENPPAGFAACPTRTSSVASTIIGPEGGTLSLNGHRLVIPAGSIAAPRPVFLLEPASDYLAVEVRPSGLRFPSRPPTLEISTARCAAPVPPQLEILRWDPESKAWERLPTPTERRGDGVGSVYSVALDHLSIYAIGTN
jgi:hypothetical protein